MDRSLTAARLARLLARLDPDRVRGAEAYERLRQTLVRFFDWRGATAPDACADDTIDRLARRLDEADIVDIRSYAQGIARLVLLEHQRQPTFESLGAAAELADAESPAGEDDQARIRDCFDRCLDALPPADRDLAVSYYEGERSGRIAHRRRLAASLGLTDNALRLRVRRLREHLERCVQQCLTR